MEMDLHVRESGKCRTEKERKAEVKRAAGLWRSGSKKEAVSVLNEIFNETAPDPDWFLPYVKEFGGEYRDLVSKLYLLHADGTGDDAIDALLYFEDECGGEGLISKLASRLAGEKWEQVRETFYDKCPQCMFMGGEDEPYSLKLRSENTIECIPAGTDLHEISNAASDYGHAMDGYSHFEGYALVKDDPEAEEDCPAEIQTILDRIEERKLPYFPNVIFPLVQGDDLLDTCRQMQDLLRLLDHGYRFESVSRYISGHPKLFPNLIKNRLKMLSALDDDDDDDDDDIDLDELLGDIKLDDEEDPDDKNNDDDIDLDELLGDIKLEGGKAEKKPRKPAKSKFQKRKG